MNMPLIPAPALAPASTGEIRPAKNDPVVKTHVPAVDHARKAMQLQGNFAMHAMSNAASTMQLLSLRPDPKTFGELLELQQAAWQRMTALQSTWLRNWADWMTDADHIRGANTLSKLAEREANLMARFVQLLGTQATDMMRLGENIEVSYRYWVSEKLERT